MGLRMIIVVVLAFLTGVTGSPIVTIRPETHSAILTSNANCVPETAEETQIFGQKDVIEETEVEETEVEEAVMETGELNPNHYPAQRAANVVQHYLNSRYGSPFRLFRVHRVHTAHAEDVPDSGRKYQLNISIQETFSNKTEACSAEVLFSKGEQRQPVQVQVSCVELIKNNTMAQEEAFYQQYKKNQSLVSSQHLPDSYGHIDPGMEPFRDLGIVASSFVMLNQSTENTLYNMAQVANLTQLPSENDQLKFNYHVLLHDMVSQEIIHWKLLFIWSSAGGVVIQKMEQLPHCHSCEKPPNTN